MKRNAELAKAEDRRLRKNAKGRERRARAKATRNAKQEGEEESSGEEEVPESPGTNRWILDVTGVDDASDDETERPASNEEREELKRKMEVESGESDDGGLQFGDWRGAFPDAEEEASYIDVMKRHIAGEETPPGSAKDGSGSESGDEASESGSGNDGNGEEEEEDSGDESGDEEDEEGSADDSGGEEEEGEQPHHHGEVQAPYSQKIRLSHQFFSSDDEDVVIPQPPENAARTLSHQDRK